MTTKTWLIEQLTCTPQLDTGEAIVFNVAWRLNGEFGTHTATCYGTTAVNYVPDTPYTPFAELTSDQVINWVKNVLGEETVVSYEDNIDRQIQDQINPPVITPQLPWTVVPIPTPEPVPEPTPEPVPEA